MEPNAGSRDAEHGRNHSNTKLKEVRRPCLFGSLSNKYFVMQLTGLSSRRSFTRQRELLQIPSNAMSNVPSSALASSDVISPPQRVRAGHGQLNMFDISKPAETAQAVTRPHTTRTETQNLNHATQTSAHLTSAHPTSNRPQLDLPPELPLAITYVDAPVKNISTAEVSSFSKIIPKDTGSGTLRNTLLDINVQASSVAVGPNVSPLVQAQSNHVQTHGQPSISKPAEITQTLSRPNVTRAESHHLHATQKSTNPMPSVSNRLQPNLTAPSAPEPPLAVPHVDAFQHISTTESLSFLNNILRGNGSTLPRNTLPASNIQASGHGNLPPAQNHDHPHAQVRQSGHRIHCTLKPLLIQLPLRTVSRTQCELKCRSRHGFKRSSEPAEQQVNTVYGSKSSRGI